MRWIKSTKKILIAAVIAAMSTASFGQLVGSTGETLVNATTTSTQASPAVAMDTSGRYVVVWESFDQDGDGYGIYAQIYNDDHTVAVAEFQVNTSVQTGDQRFPDVAITADGNFCVVWQSYEGGVSTGWDVYRRVYDISGTALTGRQRVNSVQTGNQMHAAVAAGDANFVVTYMSEVSGANESEIYGRVYDSSGSALMSATLINSSTGNHLAHPDVAMAPTGEYAFTWQSDGEDGDRNGIYSSLYDNTYSLVTGPNQVNTTTAGNQEEPRIAMDENGEYMIVWSSFDQDGDHYGIYAQRYDNAGSASGSEFAVNNTTSGAQDHVAISVTREGTKYVITWTDDTNDGDHGGVYARSYYSTGSFIDVNTIVNTTTADYQMLSDVTIGSDSTEAVFVWQGGVRDGSTGGLDTDNYGVYLMGTTVTDITPPTAICQNISVYLDGAGNASFTAADLDGGSSDNIGITSMTASATSYTCSDIGTNTVTLTVYDDAGNSDNCISAVTVVDTVSPTVACQNVTVYLDGAGNATITAADIDAGSTDNCGTPTISASQTSFTCADVGANSVTLTATDGSGNTSSCTATVTVADTTSPVAVCQDLTVYLDGSGTAIVFSSDIDAGSTDNCSIAGTSSSPAVFNCSNIGANTVTLTAVDASGNTSSCTSTVTIADTTSPTAVCQNITVYLDGSGAATITAADVDGGSTDNCSIASSSIDLSTFSCANVGANTVTLTVTDGSGNTSSCTAIVTVADTTSPTVACQNVTIYLDGAGNATITAADIDAGSTDNCGSPTMSASQTSFTCADLGANSVTLTGTDGSGNTSSCTATVTVADTTSPTVACQNITVYLDGTGNATITGSDIDAGSTDNCGTPSVSASQTSFTCADIGANSVTLTATDGSGNTSSCTSTVTIADTTSPTAVCQNITVYLDGSGAATITAADVDGGSTDNCSIASTSIDLSTFSCANAGANTVTLTVTDGSGNTSSCAAIVTVADTTAPTVACQNITVYLDGAGNATITAADIDASSTDNCGSPTMSASQTSFTCADLGANSVTLTATDGSGNTSSCTATVTVADTTAPTFAGCPSDISIAATDLGCSAVVTWTAPSESDNCSATVTSTNNPGDTFALGTTVVTYTVTDPSGNSTTCTFNVTVTSDLSVTATSTDVLCNGDSTATATATATGGSGAYSYNWSNGEIGATADSLWAGTQTVTVTDSLGCTANYDVVVSEPNALSLSATTVDETMGSDGSIDLTVTGGTPTYSYDWSNAATTQDINGLVGNMTYTVVVTDANGCMDSLDVYVGSSVGIDDLDMNTQADLNIFPNPTKEGNFTVEIIGNWKGDIRLEMVDSRGRLIYETVTTEEFVVMSFNNIEAGTYFIRAYDENDTELVRRLVKLEK